MSDYIAPPRTIRPSSLTDFADCGRRWAARHMADDLAAAGYALRRHLPVHVGAAVGSGVHAAAAWTLQEKRTSGGLGSDAEAEDRAVAEFGARSEFGVKWDETTPAIPVAKRQLARMVRSYRRNLAPEIEPLAVEERLEVDVGDGWTMSGQIDTLAGDPHSIIRDLKTGTRSRANGVQYGAYGMIYKAHGYRVQGLVEDFLQRVRVDREQPAPIALPVDLASAAADAWETIGEIKRAAAVFHARAADPSGPAPIRAFRPNPASQLCSERYCPAWGTDACTAHKR